MGLTIKEKQAVARQVRSRYLHAGRKEKSAILDEFIKITDYKNRKYALRILHPPKPPQSLLVGNGKAVKLKPLKKRPPNRTSKKIYTDEVIASLRLIWTFFWYKCGKILAPLMRQQMDAIAQWPAFGITADIKAKLLSISLSTIDRALKQDKATLSPKGKSPSPAHETTRKTTIASLNRKTAPWSVST
jgi:hypothetical protein